MTDGKEEGEFEDKWAITLLGRESVAGAENDAYEIMKEQGMEFDYGYTPERNPEASCTMVRLHGYGSVNVDALRPELARVADDRSVDVVLQAESELRRRRKLFAFDMDSTLIQGEVIDELAKIAGVADRVMAITASAMRGEIEFQESFRRRVALLAGLPIVRVHELLDCIPLVEGTERLFRTLKAQGAKTAILSGGFTFYGAYLKEKLGVDYVYANELDVDADGFVTGEVRGRIVDGAYKAELLGEIAGRENIPLSQVVAVGDGANDLPMLKLAGMGVAFHAKPVVRASAAYAMTHVGLDGLLYLMGVPDREWA